MPEVPMIEFQRMRWWLRVLMVVMVVVVIVLVWAVPTVKSLAPAEEEGEPGSKRFDHFSFHNATADPVNNVKIYLRSTGSGTWWTCTPSGYAIGTVPPGETVTWVMNREDPMGVREAVCYVEYVKPGTNPPETWKQTCTVEAYEDGTPMDTYDMNSVTFWFGNPQAAAQTAPADHELCGEGLMTPEQGNIRIVRPHSNLIKSQ